MFDAFRLGFIGVVDCLLGRRVRVRVGFHVWGGGG